MIDRVTITGADDSVAPKDLIALQEEFPFVEWGILLSETQQGGFRFPSYLWNAQFARAMPANSKISLHVCGRWTRQILMGTNPIIEYPILNSLWSRCQRVQLNFHAETFNYNGVKLVSLLRPESKQFIFQIDGTVNESIFRETVCQGIDSAPLFDTSGGAGLIPQRWPKASFVTPDESLLYHGYAGGLGPDIVLTQIPKILEAAGDSRIWIDMERRVRSHDDSQLDLAKVRKVLEQCERSVKG